MWLDNRQRRARLVQVDPLRELIGALPASASDIALNLQRALWDVSMLSEPQRWGVALASAYAARCPRLSAAVRAHVPEAVVADAQVAAVLMAQNNVYFRFRHQVGKDSYQRCHSRLAMSRRSQVADKRDYELFALAVSALHGCESCVRHHEHAALELGLSEQQVNDAIRIAAIIHATAVALEVA
jgi:lipoyl-dependent peroxiredoxin subunit D